MSVRGRTKPSRLLLYRLAGSERLGAFVRRSGPARDLTWAAARRYVGGRTLEQLLATVTSLHREGFATGVDYFGESQTDQLAVEAKVGRYLRLNEALGHVDRAVNVWLDLSNVGLDVSDELCLRQVRRIAATLPEGSSLQIRAHDSARTDRILGIVMTLAAEGVPLVPTLQANLRRSPADAARLSEAKLPVLLVKGAHIEPPEAAHRWGEETDLAFIRLAHQLHRAGSPLALATHDPVVGEAVLAALDGVEVEMLFGVRPADARELVRRGHRVRIYVPFGDDWPRYWLRRLGEARGA